VAGLPLVTGATGFAGSHLVEHLIARGPGVAAWANPRGAAPRGIADKVEWRAVDLLDRAAVAASIAELEPSVIYHCAGSADVADSWPNPVKPLQVNALGTHHLLDAVREAGLKCSVVIAGSAAIYAPSADPIREDSPIDPKSPYGVSKLAQEMVAARATWCSVLMARPFNHIGPRQSPMFATSSFARQIAEIEQGMADPTLRVGDLEARRDMTDVRDTVRGYRMLAELGRAGRPYNVCRGVAYRIGDLLDTLLTLATRKIQVVTDTARLRPSDNPVLIGDPSRMSTEIGWQPAIPIEDSLRDLLDHWRRALASARS
jgi:GDP-4-dehydro-6-deoxy-D-mannose reductase